MEYRRPVRDFQQHRMVISRMSQYEESTPNPMLYFPPSDYNHKLVGRRGKIVCSSTRFKGAWVCQTGKECWVNKSCMSNEDSDIASSFCWARSTAPDVWKGEIGDFSSSDIIQSLQLSLYSLPMTVGCIDIQIQGGMARGEKGREMEESEVSTRLVNWSAAAFPCSSSSIIIHVT